MPHVASIPELHFCIVDFDDAVAGVWNFSPNVSPEDIAVFGSNLSKEKDGYRYVHRFIFPVTENSYGMWYLYRLPEDDPRHERFEQQMRARLATHFGDGFIGGFVGQGPWMIE